MIFFSLKLAPPSLTQLNKVVGRTWSRIYHLVPNCVQTWNKCFSLVSLNKLSTSLKSKENSTPESPNLYHITLVQDSFRSK